MLRVRATGRELAVDDQTLFVRGHSYAYRAGGAMIRRLSLYALFICKPHRYVIGRELAPTRPHPFVATVCRWHLVIETTIIWDEHRFLFFAMILFTIFAIDPLPF